MIFQSQLLCRHGFRHAFPSRDERELDVAGCIGVRHIHQVRQVHGTRVALAPSAEGTEADAVLGRAGSGRIAVGVRVADCVPVLVGDCDTGDVLAIHAGWRGLVSGIVRAGLEELGSRRVVVAIGPCIGPCCFEVGADVAEKIAQESSAAVVHRKDSGVVTVDLRLAVRTQLEALGVDPSRVDDVDGCTKHQGGLFHSFRRDGIQSGRMLGAIRTNR